MVLQDSRCSDPVRWLARAQPDEPVFFYDPARLAALAARFVTGFPGDVTYAVKANPDPTVIAALAQAGVTGFDVASPAEMGIVRSILPGAVLNYHNPVRTRAEIAAGRRHGVASWSVDRCSELDKLGDIAGMEVAARLKLPVSGAVYDFGTKFGAGPDEVRQLLETVAARGGRPALTFHVGTQCRDAQAWVSYISEAARLARQAGVRLVRLNVGGGFPAHRNDPSPDLEAIFAAIRATTAEQFGAGAPPLACEPGRALVAEAFDLGLQVKAISGRDVFLNDGIYGGLSEWRDLHPSQRLTALSPEGVLREGPLLERQIFGPTCDSLDRLSDKVPLPGDMEEGDYLVFHACGAYAQALATRFNGYGAQRVVTLIR